jgi:hypothetical protein
MHRPIQRTSSGKPSAVQRIERRNWWILGLMMGISTIFFPANVTLGVGLGGVLSISGFLVLKMVVRRILLMPAHQAKLKIVLYHYLRLGVFFALLTALIALQIVDPVALIAGLSVVVLSLLLAAVLDLPKIRLEG